MERPHPRLCPKRSATTSSRPLLAIACFFFDSTTQRKNVRRRVEVLQLNRFDQDIFVVNTLIDTYAKCGSMTDSRRVFDQSKQTNLVSRMLAESRQTDALSFVAVLKACINLAAKEDDDAMIKLLKLKSLEKGMALHAEAMKTNSHNQILAANTLVDLYCKCGSLMDAEAAFGKILRSKKTDLVLLHCMMKTTEDQDRDHHQPRVNSRSFVAALKACATLAELSRTKSVHRIICRLGVEENEIVATCLLDSYCRCGSMVDAQLVFDSLATRDEVVSTGLIAGYSRQGDSQLVFELFHRIHDEGLRINEVTFVCVLTACSHFGLVDKGRKFFHAMASKYGVVPGVDHYLCMVDLLKRADQPEEAAEMQLKLKELLLTT